VDGWIKLHRCTLNKAIWKLPDAQRIVFFTILMLANHEENAWVWQGEKYTCAPGQFITSIDSLSKSAKVSHKSVRTALVNLEKLDFLANKSAKTGRLITVVNWSLYQSQEETSAKESADERQSIGKASATNKNDKNERMKEDKLSYAELVTLTKAEYEKLCDKYMQSGVCEMIEILNNYKASSGKKYKSDYHTILGWVKDKWLQQRGQPKQQPQQSGMDKLKQMARGDLFDQTGNSQDIDVDGYCVPETD
jgi:DNA replication protein DnaD